MNPLRVVYNVTSNKPADAPPSRYRDDADATDTPRSSTPLLPDGDNPERDASLADRIPRPLRRFEAAVVDWVKGPKPPRIWKIKPFFPQVQEAPLRLLDRYASKTWQRFLLLLALYFFYLLAFVIVMRRSAFSADVPGYGSPARLSCGASFWYVLLSLVNGNAADICKGQPRMLVASMD